MVNFDMTSVDGMNQKKSLIHENGSSQIIAVHKEKYYGLICLDLLWTHTMQQ